MADQYIVQCLHFHFVGTQQRKSLFFTVEFDLGFAIAKIVARRNFLPGIVNGIVDFLQINFIDDIKRGHSDPFSGLKIPIYPTPIPGQATRLL